MEGGRLLVGFVVPVCMYVCIQTDIHKTKLGMLLILSAHAAVLPTCITSIHPPIPTSLDSLDDGDEPLGRREGRMSSKAAGQIDEGLSAPWSHIFPPPKGDLALTPTTTHDKARQGGLHSESR